MGAAAPALAKGEDGEGQVVLLSGEAGIGKSRLTAALMERLGSEPHTRLRYFCSPQRADSALYPIIGQMERAAGLAHDDDPQAKLDKLDAILAQSSTSIEDAALFAEMLSLPNDGRYPTLDLTPQQRRQRTLEALNLQLEALSLQNPVLMIFEDAHWTDPTSLEAFGRAMDRIAALRVLLVVTFRPEFDPPWIGRPHVTMLTINRLTRRDIEAMIDRVVGNRPLPASIRQDIIERTDGIPLFVEEMTKAVLETESEGAARRMVAAVPSSGLAVPASLHASLMARLDRLGPAKEIAQIGAAIGREFSHVVLAAVVRKPEPELRSALDRLIGAGLLFQLGVPPNASYLFKHALVQDAAYGTLLRDSRRALHAVVAETLETDFADIAERQPELLAHHFTEAEQLEKAARLWGKAGLRSLEQSAVIEAVEQLSRALTQIARSASEPALRREEIKLQLALSNAAMLTKGYAAPETKAAFGRASTLIERAHALGEAPEDPLTLFSVLYGFWVVNFIAFDGDAMRELAGQFLALAQKQNEIVPLMIGHRLMGTSLVFTGDIAEGRAHYDQAIALYDPAVHRPLATRFGQDVRVVILCQRSLALWHLGYPESALAHADYAVRDARELGHAATLMYALWHGSWIAVQSRKYAAANALLDELIALAEEKGASFWRAYATADLGRLLTETGKALAGRQMIASGIVALQSTGGTIGLPRYLCNLAYANSELGNYEEAWRCVGEALVIIETTKQTLNKAEVHYVAGEIALKSSDETKAVAHLEQAIGVARAQQARSMELRATMSMARLWRDQGKRQQAQDLLAPVYGWFTEGFDTLDLKEAKALLDELAS